VRRPWGVGQGGPGPPDERPAILPIEWHRFRVGIPPEPPRPLGLRVGLAWLVHSKWTRVTFYFSLLPGYMLLFVRDDLLRELRHDGSDSQWVFILLLLTPVVLSGIAAREGFGFARLVAGGVVAFTRVRGVRARTAWPHGRSGVHTDVAFEYQGGRDGVDFQGSWSGRIRYWHQPAGGQLMPVLFDPEHPSRRVLLWAYGVTTTGG